MALLINPDGTRKHISGQGPHGTMTLQQLQEAVGGFIEIVHLKDGHLMVINEEGKLDQLPPNKEATMMWAERWPFLPDIIVGPVVVCSSKEIE